MSPRSGGDQRPDGLLTGLRRAWFLRRLRRSQEEEPLPGTVPRLNFRQRRMIRALLAKPEEPWTLNAIWYTFLLLPMTVADLGEELSRANLAYVKWAHGKRCLELTDFGAEEFPAILELYRSQAPLVVLFRRGPKAAGILWLLHRRDRLWRRRRKHEITRGDDRPQQQHHPKGEDEQRGEDSGLLW